MRLSKGPRVCSGKPSFPIIIYDSFSSEEGGFSPDSGHCPISLVPYDDLDDEVIVATPISIKKPREDVYSTTNKVG